MMTVITLGDIHKDLVALVERGAHPGSIDWVLRNKIEWPWDDDMPAGLTNGEYRALTSENAKLQAIIDQWATEMDDQCRDEMWEMEEW